MGKIRRFSHCCRLRAGDEGAKGKQGGQSQLFTPSPPFMTFYRRSQALAGVLRRTVRRRQTLPASLSPLPLADALNIMRTKPNKTRGIAAAALRLPRAGSRRRSIHVRRPSLIFGRSPSFSPPFAAPAFATRRRLASGLGTPIFYVVG